MGEIPDLVDAAGRRTVFGKHRPEGPDAGAGKPVVPQQLGERRQHAESYVLGRVEQHPLREEDARKAQQNDDSQHFQESRKRRLLDELPRRHGHHGDDGHECASKTGGYSAA